MFWPFSRRNDSLVAVIDIHSSAISAAYVHVVRGQKPVILGAVDYPLDPNATEPLREAVPRVLAFVLATLIRNGSDAVMRTVGHARIDRVLLSVSAPWHVHEISLLEKRENTPFTVTPNLIQELMDANTARLPEYYLTDRRITASYANGYAVDDAAGKKVRDLQLVLMTSQVERDLYSLIFDAIRAAFHTKHIVVVSLIGELFEAYRSLFPTLKDYLFLDIGSAASDSLCVKHGIPVVSRRHSFGCCDVLRNLKAQELPTTAVEKDGEISCEPETIRPLVQGIQDALLSLAQEEVLPRTILYLCHKSVIPLVREAIQDEALRKIWLTEEPPSTRLVAKQDFIDAVALYEGVQASTELCILAISAGRSLS